ncbi:subtilisin-like protein [Trichoderma chlorosporum]
MIELPDEYPAKVNETLYTTLLQHSSCTCANNQETRAFEEHWARLKLGINPSVTQNHAVFDLLFSAAPASQRTRETIWQHLRFQIPTLHQTRSVQTRSVQFKNENISASWQPHTIVQEKCRIIEKGSFCDLLGSRLGSVCIRLKIIDGQLHQLFNAEKSDQRLLKSQSVSLSTILKHQRLPSKSKILLAYILAKSVWQYYDSEFMKVPWTTDSVHFMLQGTKDDASSGEINSASPCFAFSSFAQDQFESAEYCGNFTVLYRYPRVLALAVLLVEIFLKKPSETTKARSIEERINTDFLNYSEIIKENFWPDLDLRNDEASRICKNVVRKCLDPNLFHASTSMDGSTKAAIEKRRGVLYTYVVVPLATMCADLGTIEKMDNIGQLAYSEQKLVVKLGASSKTALLNSSNEQNNYSEIWLESIMASYLTGYITKQFRSNISLARIRIAILDTGYDARSPFFTSSPREKRLLKWKDFVDNHELPVDDDGHGTYTLSLLMKIAPAADICVARIAKNTEDLTNRVSNIAEAIDWAMDSEEANVDIVAMSFGYQEEQEAINEAINKAIYHRHNQALLFAAAANYGGNQREMFPARHDQVLSVRATNHHGAFSHFNPPADRLETHVFGTLGTNVPGSGLSTCDEQVYKTGTSIATPIAAGIAATILGYARLGDASNRFGEDAHMEKLGTKRGMSQVFMRLSRQMVEKHFYLYPQEFFQEMTEMQRDALLIEAVRNV